MTTREMKVTERYLHLPVKNGAPLRRMRFLVEGSVEREFDIELAEGAPDFWVFSDLSAFEGKWLRVEAEGLPDGSDALAALRQAPSVPDADTIYRERYRPQFHFSPRRGWNNDPNGLVYHRGEYHLFFQHNPYGREWGNMHWGHAVSRDLVHWEELPVALYPRRYGDWVYSGSAVVDTRNTAGFQRGLEDTLVAIYTSTGRGECIAYSTDRGHSFTEYPGNPVVRHRGRDPKVIWYAPGKHWVMAVYDEQGEGDALSKGIAFYTSPDLKVWKFASRVKGYYECPELFELPVDGNPENTRWVLHAADGDYTIGHFDGQRFVAESGKHRFYHSDCFYASQTFNNIPCEDGRRIQIAWARAGHPEMPFNQMMGFPVELTLRTTEEGIRLFAWPVREIETLYRARHAWDHLTIPEGSLSLDGVSGELLDLSLELDPGSSTAAGASVHGVPVTYDCVKRELSCLRWSAPLSPVNGRLRIRVLVDRLSLELYANDGRVYLPVCAVIPEGSQGVELFTRGGTAVATRVEIHELRSAWEPA